MENFTKEIILKDITCALGGKKGRASFTASDFRLKEGEQMSLVGKSGSGKSSLLNLIAGFLPAERGSLQVCGKELVGVSEGKRDLIRRAHLGMVFQTYQLLDEFTVLENVLLGGYFSEAEKQNEEEASALLNRVGLSGLEKRFPHALSVGQRQRVSIARALYKKPAIILADEPTGALDKETGLEVCDLLLELSEKEGSAVIFVTHDEVLAARFKRQEMVSELITWN